MGKQLFKSLIILGIFLTCGFTMAQKTITGTVSDADGPLPGATVVVQGTSNGVTSDFDGNYSIEANEGDVLEFSFIGMTTGTATVGSDSVINITLAGGDNTLEEVVVVGYSQQTRGDITGSVASVDMEEALKVPTVNAAEALQGRVTGVTVVSNGNPGAAPNVNIRGIGSTNGTGPLYIIDGVQTTDPNVLTSINPGDIDQMNVLKDGAAAIYGSRASNGVIIVTTKSGSYNMEKSSLTVDIYTGVSNPINDPSLLNLQQHADMLWEGYTNDVNNGGGDFRGHVQYGNDPNGPVLPSVLDISNAGSKTDGVIARVQPGGTNWWNEITQSAPTVSATVSMAGGTETSKSFMSVNYFNRGGVVKHTGFAKASIQVNNEFKPVDRLKVGQHLNVSYTTQQYGDGEALESAFRATPLMPVYAEQPDGSQALAGTYSNTTDLSNTRQPYALAFRARNNYIRNIRTFGDVYASYDFTDHLTFKTTFAGSIGVFDQTYFNPLDPEHGEAKTVNQYNEQDQTFFNWTWTNMLSYRNTFADNHNLNVFVATEALEQSNKGKQVSRTDYFNESPDFYLLSNGFGDPAVDFAYANGFTLFSVFGSADYNYKSKYFFTATVRYDKSSRFAGDNKSAVFPSFSAGWVMSSEDWFNNSGVVNRLKLKGSWGQLGSQDLPVNNPTQTLYAFNIDVANYVFGGGSPSVSDGAILNSIGNTNLQWETSVTSNFGIELDLFNSKLSTSLEFYQILTDGLFARNSNLIPSTGPEAPPPFVNLGEVKNTGVDWSVSYNNTWDNGFSLGATFNLSHYRNEVVSLVNGTPINGNALTSWAGAYTRTEEGEPISYFYGRKIAGFTDTGRWVYEDVNEDGVVDDNDRTKIGSPHPDFTYGLNINAGFKGFDLSAFFNGSQGNDIYNHNQIFNFPNFPNGNRTTAVLDSWRPDNTDASMPALSNSLQGVEVNANDFFVEDGSFFRLKNLQLGYSLPSTATDKMGMERFRIYLQGTNLFTITGYDGIDPEILPRSIGGQAENLNMGIDSRTYPLSQIFTIGLNIKF
ncbi:SusC/RagA family TonB-linked outer membrane protein [Lutimonas sp.]|uniref:SusC/RagA family TonB-linked outer membrane protein n=1 Tax=Lutimonas sp. TaxID=1872403 RepID=UPI003C784987